MNNKKEIGGYFELEHFHGMEYHKGAIALNTARNALLYVIKAKRIKKIYIPYFLCDCIEIMLKKNMCEYEFYNINSFFLPEFQKKLNEDEYLYIVNYYGQLSNSSIFNLKEKFGNIIIDNVQAFFQYPITGVDTIYSCRKFFGVPDGAYLYTSAHDIGELEVDSSLTRFTHLLGRFEQRASNFYGNFKMVDESFIEEDIKKMSSITKNLLKAIDYEYVMEARNKNFMFLHSKLKENNQLKISKSSGAFCYPFYNPEIIKEPNFLRKMLVEKNIYIPIYWPNVLQERPEGSIEYDFANGILALPCDQRYTLDDLMYIQDILKEYF